MIEPRLTVIEGGYSERAAENEVPEDELIDDFELSFSDVSNETSNDLDWDDDLFDDLDLDEPELRIHDQYLSDESDHPEEDLTDLSGSVALPDDWADFDYG